MRQRNYNSGNAGKEGVEPEHSQETVRPEWKVRPLHSSGALLRTPLPNRKLKRFSS
jgi:hypothetical protein